MKFSPSQIEQSIRTGRLALDRRDMIRYFRGGIPHLIFFFVLPVAIFVFLTDIQIRLWLIVSAVALLIAGIVGIISILRLLDLRLIKDRTQLPEELLRERVVKFAKLKKWKVANNRKSLMILKTGPGRSGSTGWGERITLITQGCDVWISSISDPDRPMSLRSSRRNKNNIRFVKDVLSGRRVPTTETVDL